MTLDESDHINCLRLAMDSCPQALRRYMDLISPFLDEEIEKELARISTDSTSKVQYIVVEYISLPQLAIWSKADYRIIVDAPKEERNLRLYERERDDTISIHSNPKCGEIREAAVKDLFANAENISYLLYNTYDGHLEKEVIYLCGKISNAQNLLVPH